MREHSAEHFHLLDQVFAVLAPDEMETLTSLLERISEAISQRTRRHGVATQLGERVCKCLCRIAGRSAETGKMTAPVPQTQLELHTFVSTPRHFGRHRTGHRHDGAACRAPVGANIIDTITGTARDQAILDFASGTADLPEQPGIQTADLTAEAKTGIEMAQSALITSDWSLSCLRQHVVFSPSRKRICRRHCLNTLPLICAMIFFQDSAA